MGKAKKRGRPLQNDGASSNRLRGGIWERSGFWLWLLGAGHCKQHLAHLESLVRLRAPGGAQDMALYIAAAKAARMRDLKAHVVTAEGKHSTKSIKCM